MSTARKLSRREREIMDILHEMREATAQQVRERLPDPPSNSAARALLARLEAKGYISHLERGLKYIYRPAVSREEAKQSAIARLAKVFFEGSMAGAVSGMVEQSGEAMSDAELDELEAAIREARRKRSAQ